MYTVDYFIKKFEAIPENRWLNGMYGSRDGAACAYGHCDGNNLETHCLEELLMQLPGLTPMPQHRYMPYDGTPARINNGEVVQYQQPTPKQRILAALYDIKKMQQPQYEDVTKSLAVLPVSETSDLIKQSQPCTH